MRPALSGFTLRDHGSIDPRDVVGGVHQSA
jgi:2-phospho-L-lactate guanylyltransferase